jgi:FixJ family two-component response regulator
MQTLRTNIANPAIWEHAEDTIDRTLAELSSHDSCPSRPPSSARTASPLVFVVGNDEYVRPSLTPLIAAAGFDIESCESAEEFLSLPHPAVPCCLVLDTSLPGADGLDLQRRLRAGTTIPIVFITGRADVRLIVEAMKAGAVDVLAKPVNAEHLRSAIDTAIEVSRAAVRRDATLQPLRDCYASLTPREREVMGLVVSGLLNKQVAFELGISEITVKAHRGQVMRKMKADSLPHLVRMAARLDAASGDSMPQFM